ncbi:Flp family type IVb pilin [Chengkuizengella sp. SCS-71B]|uniref:Flp family type IVb pilin n=1 Tax=Chengkuizengella sp. SCS-71B TaxID=3115290 RepID=UPI0032C2271C
MLKNKLVGLVKEEKGQGLTEYGLVLGIIAVAVVGVIIGLRNQIFDLFNDAYQAVLGRDGATPPTEGQVGIND